MPKAARTHRQPTDSAARLRPLDVRPPAHKRGYDSRWYRVRRSYIIKHPLCEKCSLLGRTVMAAIVDHIVPLSAGGPKYDHSNLQSLCRSCHALKTAEDARKY